MKILFFTSLFPNREQPFFCIFSKERVRFLAKRCEVKVCAPTPYFPGWLKSKKYRKFSRIDSSERMSGVEVFHPRYFVIPKIGRFFNGISLFLSVWRKVNIIKKDFDFDVIDAHFAYPDGFAAALIAKLTKKPLVITVHGTDINLYPSSFILRQQIRFALNRADRIIAVCQALKDKMMELGIDGNKIEVVPNGVDLEKFKIMDKFIARKELGLPIDKRIIISVGHLIERKGFHYLLEAAAHINDENCLFIIIGEGEYRQYLESRIKNLNLSGRARLVGAIAHEDICKWHNASDLFILTSSREGWPTVFFEAFACGKPVVATKTWGTPEALSSPDHGILVEGQSSVKIASAISEALNTRWDTAKLVGYARKNSWNSVADRTMNIYKQALSDFCAQLQRTIVNRLSKMILSAGFWQVEQPIGVAFDTKEKGSLKGYYSDLSRKVVHKGVSKDGIPLTDYGGKVGLRYYPITIAQKALGHYEVWLKNKEDFHKKQFVAMADWLVDNQKIREGEVGVWEADFSLPRVYHLKVPWVSAMAQGESISVLLRAHQETKDGRYLDAAKRALCIFDHTIEDSGVKTVDIDGSVFYEEYPSVPYSHVLNGFIFALWGLYDYAKYLSDRRATDLFNMGIESLKKNLTRYDLGYWSRYDLFKLPITPIASKFYHKLHICQLKALYEMTGDEIFLNTAQKWEGYLKSRISSLRYIMDKIILKVYNVLIVRG